MTRHRSQIPDSLMSQCLERIVAAPLHEKLAFKRLLIEVCDNKEKANNLRQEMVRRSFIEPIIRITEKARGVVQGMS